MSGPVLFIASATAHGGSFGLVAARAGVRVVPQWQLCAADLDDAAGLITTMHLDQPGLMGFVPQISALLARAGRWVFNGHMMRPFLPGLAPYVPLIRPGRADLALSTLADHPVFAGISREGMSTRKGVAGFYGRGYNPLPQGAVAITGIGPARHPVDWDWAVPGGGRLFSHAGNDLAGNAENPEAEARLAANIIAWTQKTEGALPWG
ncbi:MAG: hypothetical protein ACK5IB_05315 [Qingshengfaniella sp.]